MDDLIQDFLSETSESLLDLDAQLVELESNPNNPDLLNTIFRIMHTIKGTCGFLGLSRLEKVAHNAENLLDKFRDGEKVTSYSVTVILLALDRIKEIVEGIGNNDGQEIPGDDSALLDQIGELYQAILDGTHEQFDGSGVKSKGAASAEPAAQEEVVEEAPEEVEEAPAPVEEAAPAPKKEAIKKEPEKAAPAQGGGTAPAQTVRISVTLLDDLMDLVGELVLSRNQIQQIERNINMQELSVPVQNLSHVASELQESVMKTRMQPIGVAFKVYPRIIRDLANDLGKKIALETIGEETEMDRQILELIKDPLTHMIRNCADHALETPAERIAAGKAAQGKIVLQAYHEGGHIIINIKDDGR